MMSEQQPSPTDRILTRRSALGALAGLGAAAFLAACGSDSKSTSSSSSASSAASSSSASSSSSAAPPSSAGSTASTAASSGAAATPIPEETGGPFPGDGSNGPNALNQDGVVRQDIRSSFGSSSGVAEGVPLTMKFTVADAATGAAMAGAAVYAWHCDRDGEYSMYGQSVTDENYLRGVQVADSSGNVSFTTIFPAAYSGRWPHVHLEIYSTVEEATGGGSPVRTTQMALPEDVCTTVYATTGYEQSVSNLQQTSLSSDNVFGDDDGVHELGTVTGSMASGLVASLALPI